MNWSRVAQQISNATGRTFVVRAERAVAGGCINNAVVIEDEDRTYFVKHNRAERLDMFRAEATGLNELRRAQTVRVPQPICWGVAGDDAYLVLEYFALGGKSDGARLGRELAALHRNTQTEFGWHLDNTIGSTPQPNSPRRNWLDFWREQRLGFQLGLAAQHGHRGRLLDRGERLLADCGALFANYAPTPALVHGDLWSGNSATDVSGVPVLFDPAPYYGDRETDLAMTELFGGFPPRFYSAYNEMYALDIGYPVRKTFYNLYHVLNHLNLFGGAYLGQAQQMIDELLSELS